MEGNSACHGFDNGSKPPCASFTNPIRCTIPFVHVNMYTVDMFAQFTHAPITISNEFNSTFSNNTLKAISQLNTCSSEYVSLHFIYILIILIITWILQGSGFFSHKICWSKVKSAICPWDSSEEKGCAWCLWQKVISAIEQHSYQKRKRERERDASNFAVYMSFQEMLFSRRCL